MDGWMAGLGAAPPPNTDALGQLLFEYSKRVYTSQLQHLKDMAGTLATEEAEDAAQVAKLRSALESAVDGSDLSLKKFEEYQSELHELQKEKSDRLQKVFKDFNISSEDLNSFFGGPAFLARAHMGNLHGWGGPLSQNWLDQQLVLQKQIIPRMLELGMIPVLPSFSGNVPAALRKIFPSAKITRVGDWNTVDADPRWCCTYLLDPSDPRFVEIGKAFIRKQIKEYGDVTNIYNCDTFNENSPPTSDPDYISTLGAAVYQGITKGDKDAVWLMQGWLFYSDSSFWKPPQMKALLQSVPVGKMIVLDLFAEVKPFWKTTISHELQPILAIYQKA